MGNAQLALAASRLSGQYVEQGSKAAWLDLFAEDACVQDPVGKSPLDPSGLGHIGKAAIADFWDMVIAAGDIEFTIVSSHPAGDECANVVRMVNNLPGDIKMELDMVVVYTANGDGKITSLKAYWDFDAVQQQLS
ncbi:nuclear transport factor 2 family protein [Zhongshania sp.]|jgi:ketosteroid isomerase-like protein|uniref:nuclear transport factor 2 family protein n=1 Tax=Zhongshania sp. TaxID=1971902 RepID=UPI001B5264FB|nr:nuclear transport factor 2 family protein [Zhongshania sp.]MBQ0797188.1 nuclear transport factor 2 family protein [Zhongshania sp.]